MGMRIATANAAAIPGKTGLSPASEMRCSEGLIVDDGGYDDTSVCEAE